jgi:hypothetical protein
MSSPSPRHQLFFFFFIKGTQIHRNQCRAHTHKKWCQAQTHRGGYETSSGHSCDSHIHTRSSQRNSQIADKKPFDSIICTNFMSRRIVNSNFHNSLCDLAQSLTPFDYMIDMYFSSAWPSWSRKGSELYLVWGCTFPTKVIAVERMSSL